MESLETIIKNKLHDIFKCDVHVKQKGNALIVDLYFYDSSLFHTYVLLPQEMDITSKLCNDLTSCIINDYISYY